MRRLITILSLTLVLLAICVAGVSALQTTTVSASPPEDVSGISAPSNTGVVTCTVSVEASFTVVDVE